MTNDRPKVFHLITRLLKGGAEAKTIETVLGLDGYSFTVGFGNSFEPEQRTVLESADISTVQFPLLRHYNPVTNATAVLSIARHLRREEYDIVHTHSTEAGIVGRLAAKLAGVPKIVHTVHGVPFTSDRHPLLNYFVLACERSTAPMTDRILTNADIIADEYLDRGIGRPDQYMTAYSGIDLDRFRNANPADNLPGDGPYVTMVARMADGKGFEVLLDAVERLDTEAFSVLLVGDGPMRDTIETEIANRALADTVHTLGFREDVPELLAASDVFVLPSFREGTPRVITEAMASGLPIVSTDIAGIPEQVEDGENGYLVKPGDTSALVETLDDLLSNAERRTAFGQHNQTQAEAFSKDKMLIEIDDVYRELLDE